jgi:hypothetical protein
MTKKPEAISFNEDYPVVILGAHLSKEDAIELAKHDLGRYFVDYGIVERVHHWYVKYRFQSDEDYISGYVDDKPVRVGAWYMCKTRPKGVFRKATVLEWLP